MDQFAIVVPLATAFVESSLIGLEREFRYKSAGLRTHTLVGMGSALFVLVGKYGFPSPSGITGDASRVAAQVVTGIGFIGAGLIVHQRDRVLGLTSAAVIWLTAAVGMACGAGLWQAGAATIACYFAVMFLYPSILRRVPRSKWAPSIVKVTYRDGKGTLRSVLGTATERGYSVEAIDVTHQEPGHVQVALVVRGRGSLHDLVAEVDALDSVLAVSIGDDQATEA